jgi:hypothetical protein
LGALGTVSSLRDFDWMPPVRESIGAESGFVLALHSLDGDKQTGA